jgi:hypothetical protein
LTTLLLAEADRGKKCTVSAWVRLRTRRMPDKDCVPHAYHRWAIEMVKVKLKYGKDRRSSGWLETSSTSSATKSPSCGDGRRNMSANDRVRLYQERTASGVGFNAVEVTLTG